MDRLLGGEAFSAGPESDATPFIIPVFISHHGCPHRCLFCNQASITGSGGDRTAALSAATVTATIEQQLGWPRRNPGKPVQVAFYGGSFTGLARTLQEELLGAVRPYLRSGRVQEIRLSTRPDYIDRDTPGFLQAHGVSTVELGVQSMEPEVLERCQRGHTVEQVGLAMRILREGGVSLGVQLMLGLPGQSTAGVLAGARQLAAMGPDFARIYPTLVVRGSGLARLYEQGQYHPLSLSRAVVLSARVWSEFAARSIPVVRMGLQAGSTLAADLLAGPFHPAFGELVMSHLMYRKLQRLLAGSRSSGPRRLVCAAADQSIVRGQRNCNMARLERAGLLAGVSLDFAAGRERYSALLVDG